MPNHLLYLPKNTFFTSADDEFPLVCADGAEGASSKASPVNVDREFNHVVGGNALVFIFRMRQPCVWKVERGIQFSSCHRRVGRIDHDVLLPHFLNQPAGMYLVGFFLDVAVIFGFVLFVLQALFV